MRPSNFLHFKYFIPINGQCCKRWKELQSAPHVHYGMCGFPNQSNNVQQILSKLLKYNLINSEESKTDKKYASSGNGSIQTSCTSKTKRSDGLENHDESNSGWLDQGVCVLISLNIDRNENSLIFLVFFFPLQNYGIKQKKQGE